MTSKRNTVDPTIAKYCMHDESNPIAGMKKVGSFPMTKAACAAKVASGEWVEVADGVYEDTMPPAA